MSFWDEMILDEETQDMIDNAEELEADEPQEYGSHEATML